MRPPAVDPPLAAPPPARPRSFRDLRDAVRASPHVTRFATDGDAAAWSVLTLSLVVGLTLGLVLPADAPGAGGRASAVVGWASTGCWMIGWYPNLALAFVTRSVAGQSLDFIVLNAAGFAAYTAYTALLFASPAVRAQYRAVHGSDPAVRSNDLFFAAHALLCTLAGAVQAVRYDRGGQTVSRPVAAGTTAAVAAVATYAAVWGRHADCGGCSLRLVYVLGAVKVASTVVKYVPQLVHNAARRSTLGYNVANATTDAAGGVLSLAQQGLDAALARDASVLVGNPAKLALAALSLLYDAALACQHYCLYRDDGGGGEGGYERLA